MQITHWVRDTLKLANNTELAGSLSVDGFQIDVTSSEPGYYFWAERYLQPLVNKTSTSASGNFRIQCLHSDEAIVNAMAFLRSSSIASESLSTGGRRVRRIEISPEVIVDIDRRKRNGSNNRA